MYLCSTTNSIHKPWLPNMGKGMLWQRCSGYVVALDAPSCRFAALERSQSYTVKNQPKCTCRLIPRWSIIIQRTLFCAFVENLGVRITNCTYVCWSSLQYGSDSGLHVRTYVPDSAGHSPAAGPLQPISCFRSRPPPTPAQHRMHHSIRTRKDLAV